ncbi:MAG: hypothetical protein NTY74_12190 [Ignavibacteriae bacterium]|nr:hypothetical protein [Ignavibacteriota bacterium]
MQTSSISVGSNSSEGIRLLQPQSFLHSEGYGELALLSKRKARTELRIGNDSLNELIKKGEIKTTRINKRDKIPYVSIQEYINKVSSERVPEFDKYENDNEDDSIAMANKIIQDILKGG